MRQHTKPEAEKNSDGNGKRVDSDSNSCSSYSDNDNDGDAIDMYWLLKVCGVIRGRCRLLQDV